MSSNTVSPVKQFNNTVKGFLADLKTLFDDNDKDINTLEMACDMTVVNVRLVLTPFQQYIANDREFVKNILQMNVDYFLEYNYNDLMKQSIYNDDYNNKLLRKFSEATRQHRHNQKTVDSIFNWFKVMIYYAYVDQGKDPKAEMDAANALMPDASQTEAVGASTTT